MAMKSFKSTLAGIASRVGDTQAALTTIDTDLDAAIVLLVADKALFDAAVVLLLADEAGLDTAIAAFVAKTATDAAVGVLVADGVAPTQAHVNDLSAAWATFETAWDSAQTLLAALAVSLNTTRPAFQTAITSLAASDAAFDAVAVKSTAAMAVIDADANFSVNTTLSMNEVLAALRAFETQARSTF